MEREEIKQVVIELIHDKGFFGDEVTEETTLEDMAWVNVTVYSSDSINS